MIARAELRRCWVSFDGSWICVGEVLRPRLDSRSMLSSSSPSCIFDSIGDVAVLLKVAVWRYVLYVDRKDVSANRQGLT